MADKLKWWHTIEMPDGSITPGEQDYRGENGKRFLLPEDLTGKSVLDFGTWDGFFIIEAKKRGASRCVASDRFSPPLETTKIALGAFDIPYEHSGDLDFPLRADFPSGFDVVLFYGILYHLKNPYMGLLNAVNCCARGGIVIVESAVNQGKSSRIPPDVPALWVIDTVHDNDPTNYFVPNEQGLIQLCILAGLEPPFLKGMDPSGTRMTVACRLRPEKMNALPAADPFTFNRCVLYPEVSSHAVDAVIQKLEFSGDLSQVDGAYAHLRDCGGVIHVGPPLQGIDGGWSYLRMYDPQALRSTAGDKGPVSRAFELVFTGAAGWHVSLAGQERTLSPRASWNLGRLGLSHLSTYFPSYGRAPAPDTKPCANPRQAAVLLWWKAWLDAATGSAARFDAATSLAWRELGVVLCRNWQYQAGAECFRHLADRAECDYRRLEAIERLAGALVTSGKNPEALEVIDEASAEPYRDGHLITELLLWQARALRDLGRFQEAEQVGLINLRRSRALLSPGIAKVSMLFLGRLYLRQRRWLALAKMAARLAGMTAEPGLRLLVSRIRSKIAAVKPAHVATLVTAPPPRDIHRIAVARLDGLGDLIMTVPALRLLRRYRPEATIDMFVAKPWGEVVRWLGMVNNVYEVDGDFRDSSQRSFSGFPGKLAPYDVAIDMIHHPRAFQDHIMSLIPARFHLGYDTPFHRGRCNLRVRMPTYRRHAADMNLELLSGIGITPVGEDDRIPRLDRVVIEPEAAWKDKLDGEVVGIHPGAGWPLRKWYPDKFARVADQVAERTGRRIAVMGSVSDEPMVRQIIKGMSGPAESIICHNIRQLAGATSALRLLICNDSGPMHLAGALGVPMVVVWGPGDYEQYSPRGSKAIVIRHQPLCAPCCQEGAPTRCGMGHAWPDVACLTPITPHEVVGAACRLLET